MNKELQDLEKLIEKSDYVVNNRLEPNVGDAGTPQLADKYGTRGQSIFTVFLKNKDDGAYGCKFERCLAYSTRNLDQAIRHIRHHHFNHFPFPCVPLNGNHWYVSHCPLFYSSICTR
jgi:hypothetical protein